MIIIGYPGIGKSTLARRNKDYIDLESSCFFINNKRPEDWQVIYCKVAEDLSRQGKVVFVSSHKEVVDELLTTSEKVLAIYPDPKLKDEWIKRLKDRYEFTCLEKDRKAYQRALEHFDEDIDGMRRCLYIKIALQDMDYCLKCNIEEWRHGEIN